MNMNLTKNFPTHVGIIMDGNGRWATRRGLPRLAGHRMGVESIKRAIDNSIKLGIKILTFYAFSTENWKRDKEEIDGIFNLVREYLTDNLSELNSRNIKLTYMGNLDKLPQDLANHLKKASNDTENNTGLIVNLAVNYGSRDEIVRACNLLIKSGKNEVTAKDLEQKLYSANLPDPDLIIRTGGEKRLSNFMLYQIAYSELYFTKIYWPTFNMRHLKKAIKNFSKRERRFGGNHKRKQK